MQQDEQLDGKHDKNRRRRGRNTEANSKRAGKRKANSPLGASRGTPLPPPPGVGGGGSGGGGAVAAKAEPKAGSAVSSDDVDVGTARVREHCVVAS
jgi:hypothetical protein